MKCDWRSRVGREMRAESRLETEHNGHSIPLLQTTTPNWRERTKGNALPQRQGGVGGTELEGGRNTGFIGGGEWTRVEGWALEHCMREKQAQKCVNL